jgi:predicted AlkP superfamily pyrophosphatase or phosphodiesterase
MPAKITKISNAVPSRGEGRPLPCELIPSTEVSALMVPRTLILRPARKRLKRTAGLVLFVLGALAFWSAAPSSFPSSAPGGQAKDRHVLVISVDGMGGQFLAQTAPKVHAPNLQRLRQEGSYAEGVLGVYPSLTYPSHTTLVTGRMPAEHGIYTNLSSREAGKNPGDWFWFSKAIKVPTLWDEARSHRLSTAAVFWPVTAGAPIEWDVPEIWDPQKGEAGDPLYVAKFATPGLLFQALLEIGPPQQGADEDVARAQLAAFILKKYEPTLLLFHLASLDREEHRHGPASPEVAATLELEDKLIGELLDGDQAAGLAGSTDVFVVSDHGFLPVENEIAPNVLLANAGLLTLDAQGRVSGGKIATVDNGGSFFIYWPEGEDLRPAVDAALKPLREQGVVWGILNRGALRDLGSEPAVQMALEAQDGWDFSSRATGDVVKKLSGTRGTHGYLPLRPALQASFIAWGPGIRPGLNLHLIPMTALAPTILKALGIDDPKFGSTPPLAEIFK